MPRNLGMYAVIAVALYLGYKVMSGVGSTVTAPFNFAADTAEGVFGAGGDVFGGVMDTADNIGDFGGGITSGAGEIVNDTLAVPGDLIDTGQGAVYGTVDTVSSTVDDTVSGVQDTFNNLW